ncbi:MAG: nuclear transport factor 2 family protein [Terriglobales bacterium]
MTGVLRVLLCLSLCSAALSFAEQAQSSVSDQASNSEQTVWNLEHAYWDYVQSNNLPAYRELWHKRFVGWPSVSDSPVDKDHITDWITSQTSKGLAFKTVEVKPARIQLTGNIAMTYYRVTFKWLDKDGKGEAHTIRITHTWLQEGKDWRIIGGMSMPEPAPQSN